MLYTLLDEEKCLDNMNQKILTMENDDMLVADYLFDHYEEQS